MFRNSLLLDLSARQPRNFGKFHVYCNCEILHVLFNIKILNTHNDFITELNLKMSSLKCLNSLRFRILTKLHTETTMNSDKTFISSFRHGPIASDSQ